MGASRQHEYRGPDTGLAGRNRERSSKSLSCLRRLLRLDQVGLVVEREQDRLVEDHVLRHLLAGSRRVIPLFSELLHPLSETFDAAPDGAVYVVTRHRSQADAKNGSWRNANRRTRFNRMVKRAGSLAQDHRCQLPTSARRAFRSGRWQRPEKSGTVSGTLNARNGRSWLTKESTKPRKTRG